MHSVLYELGGGACVHCIWSLYLSHLFNFSLGATHFDAHFWKTSGPFPFVKHLSFLKYVRMYTSNTEQSYSQGQKQCYLIFHTLTTTDPLKTTKIFSILIIKFADCLYTFFSIKSLWSCNSQADNGTTYEIDYIKIVHMCKCCSRFPFSTTWRGSGYKNIQHFSYFEFLLNWIGGEGL